MLNAACVKEWEGVGREEGGVKGVFWKKCGINDREFF